MSVIARIKPKGLFKKKMSIQEIIGYTNLSYGVCDENYRLIENEIAKHTLLYDNAKPARGIDISMDEFDVVLQLSLPTTPSEIHLFYNTIQSLCNLYKVTTYIREEEKVHIKENEKFIRYDIEGSIEGLKDIESKIQKNTYQRFEIFGIYNPISIGINEINKFHHDLNRFALIGIVSIEYNGNTGVSCSQFKPYITSDNNVDNDYVMIGTVNNTGADVTEFIQIGCLFIDKRYKYVGYGDVVNSQLNSQ